MIMADQDQDGSHIKGLLINFIHHFWPSLLHLSDFLVEFITPIVKCTKGKHERSFFTLPQYQVWAETENVKGWKIKYYKGSFFFILYLLFIRRVKSYLHLQLKDF